MGKIMNHLEKNMGTTEWILITAISAVITGMLFFGYTSLLHNIPVKEFLILWLSSTAVIPLLTYYYIHARNKEETGVSPYIISCLLAISSTIVIGDILSLKLVMPEYAPYVIFPVCFLLSSIILIELAGQFSLYGKKALAAIAYVSAAFIISSLFISVISYDTGYEKGRKDLMPGVITYMEMYQKQFEVVMGVDDNNLNISSVIGENYSSTRDLIIERTIHIVNTRSLEKNYSFSPILRTEIGNYTDIILSNNTGSVILYDSSNSSYYYEYVNSIPGHGIQEYTVTFHFHKAPEWTWEPVCCGGNTIQMGGVLFSIQST